MKSWPPLENFFLKYLGFCLERKSNYKFSRKKLSKNLLIFLASGVEDKFFLYLDTCLFNIPMRYIFVRRFFYLKRQNLSHIFLLIFNYVVLI